MTTKTTPRNKKHAPIALSELLFNIHPTHKTTVRLVEDITLLTVARKRLLYSPLTTWYNVLVTSNFPPHYVVQLLVTIIQIVRCYVPANSLGLFF